MVTAATSPTQKYTLEQIQDWYTSPDVNLRVAMRSNVYQCFYRYLPKIGKDLTNAINNTTVKTDKERIQLIKTVLAKYNLYDEQ